MKSRDNKDPYFIILFLMTLKFTLGKLVWWLEKNYFLAENSFNSTRAKTTLLQKTLNYTLDYYSNILVLWE